MKSMLEMAKSFFYLDKTDEYWMKGARITGDDWTGSVITQDVACIIRNGYKLLISLQTPHYKSQHGC